MKCIMPQLQNNKFKKKKKKNLIVLSWMKEMTELYALATAQL